MNDREEEELGFDEFQRKKRGSGKVPSSRNPKGAGRPRKEWREYQEFLEYKKLRGEGVTPRGLTEIIDGLIGHGDRRGEGDSKRDAPEFMGRILKAFGIKEKDLKKIKLEQIDEEVVRAYNHISPYILPRMLKPASIFAGLGAWYLAEEKFTVTKQFTPQHWEAVPRPIKAQYYYVRTIDGVVHATRKRLQPQIAHTIVLVLQWLVNVINGIMSFLTGDMWKDSFDKLQNMMLENQKQKDLYEEGIWRFEETQVMPSDIAADVDEDEQVDWGEERLEDYILEMQMSCIAEGYQQENIAFRFMSIDLVITYLRNQFSEDALRELAYKYGCLDRPQMDDDVVIVLPAQEAEYEAPPPTNVDTDRELI